MPDSRTIKTKLKTVGNIQKITRAMEMVATSKMKRAIDKALSVRPFAYFGLEFLLNFAQKTSEANADRKESGNISENIFYKTTLGTRTLIVEIASNKGLVGGYNANMFRELRNFVLRENLHEVDYIAVGKYAVQHVQKITAALQGNLINSFTNFSTHSTLSDVQQLVDIITAAYATGVYKNVLVAYTQFGTTISQTPTLYQLLPVSPDIVKNQLASSADEQARVQFVERDMNEYVVEPSVGRILDVIIPKLITAQVYQSLLESMASEQASQMVAMKNASDNAEDLQDKLMLSYNHIRQEGITRELSEIAAGAEVMNA